MVVTVNKGTAFTSLEAKMIGYNYTEFIMILTSAPKKVDDGVMALAQIADLDGKILVSTPRRMVFAGDTAPARIIAKAKNGAKLQALGIPRLNLERLMVKADEAKGQAVDVKGAYEMISSASPRTEPSALAVPASPRRRLDAIGNLRAWPVLRNYL